MGAHARPYGAMFVWNPEYPDGCQRAPLPNIRLRCCAMGAHARPYGAMFVWNPEYPDGRTDGCHYTISGFVVVPWARMHAPTVPCLSGILNILMGANGRPYIRRLIVDGYIAHDLWA